MIGEQGFVNTLEIVSGLAALALGFYWVRSARIKITWPAMNTYGGPAPVVMQELNQQTSANAKAAWLSGIAAFAHAIAMAAPSLWKLLP